MHGIQMQQNAMHVPPQLAAYISQMIQQSQAQHYTTDSNGQQLLMQQTTATPDPRQGFE
jgi:hypothetical protein